MSFRKESNLIQKMGNTPWGGEQLEMLPTSRHPLGRGASKYGDQIRFREKTKSEIDIGISGS